MLSLLEVFELEEFYYSTRMGLSLAKQLMSQQKMFVISKVHYFNFLVSCLYTFNPLSLSLKWVVILVETKCSNMERGKSCKITNLNIFLWDSYKADEIVMEIEEWKQKRSGSYVKSFGRVLLGVLETLIVS